ncbi:hypothetical protein [Caballeronia sp. LZ001]|uniref:hypothetical protein n=1 Tax=Caballeronia sp. LZ001 TaxID=3038553 RepID=UPI0028594A29|nr:hypothetical protein [Caballeronia sp. LZ001]MDR5801161.1 hypothetical protein [Caballeronia sp. LZ001]
MSRSGYSDDCDGWALIRWRGAVNSAIKGERGQAFLSELAAALDAMPEKRLIADELETADGDFCTIGVLGAARGIDMSKLDPDDREAVAEAFNIAPALAAEIVFENDEGMYPWDFVEIEICGPMRPWDRRVKSVCVPKARQEEARWHRMRQWVESHIVKAKA